VEACTNAYTSLVIPESSSSEDNQNNKGVISATWIRDEDIQRLLKSLPNWQKLSKAKEEKSKGSNNKGRGSAGGVESPETPEEVRNQNLRESDLLSGIFNGKTVQKHEILSDPKQLRALAHLQESLEWFSSAVEKVAAALAKESTQKEELKEHTEIINEYVGAFRKLSDVCLLVLHLEVRVHCFHFLLPMAQNGEFAPGVDSQNADTEVTKLSRDLMVFQGVVNSSLDSVKAKVGNFGHLIMFMIYNNGNFEFGFGFAVHL